MKNRIKEVRKYNKLTQVEFGEKIGVKGNTVTSYETGLRTPSGAVIFLICREFHVNEEWLRNGTGEPYKEPGKDILVNLSTGDSSLKHRVLTALAQLNEEEWMVLEKVVASISSLGDTTVHD